MFLCSISFSFANLRTGDIAFTAFNADGDDDFAIVTFVDLNPNTIIIFCDSELNGQGQFGTDENDFSWNSGSNTIPQGTVITFNSISSVNRSVNFGSIVGTPGGMSASGEAMFAFVGTLPRTVTTLLAAIGSGSITFGDLTNSGLTLGSTAINLPSNVDIAQYNGTRTGLNVSSYISSLNNMSNWLTQDNATDDQNDAIAPDVPFNSTVFVIANTDLLPPNVVSVTVSSQNTISVLFSEAVNFSQAQTISNYSFNPSLTINSAVYNSSTFTTTLNTNNLTIGTFYTLTVQNIQDIANNTMALSSNPNIVFNNTTPNLVFSEIMYNPHSNGDDYEFLEIYNAGSTTATIGGLKVKDEANFNVTLPEMTLAAGSTMLLATNAQVAGPFYNRSFIDIPGTGNFLGNGGETLQILNSTNQVLLSVFYDDASPWSLLPDGTGPSLELKNPATDNNNGENWKAATNNLGSNGIAVLFGTPGTFTPEVNVVPNIAFSAVNYVVNENSGSVNVIVNLSAATSQTVLCSLRVVTTFGTANNGSDYTFTDRLLTFAPNSTSQTINIPITDNNIFNPSKLFMLELSNNTNSNLGTNFRTTVYIKENENGAPVAQNTLGISHIGSFKPSISPSSSAEIVVHEPTTQRLFIMNSLESKIEIYDFSNPAQPTKISTLDMNQYGPDATSVAVKNGIVAATIDPFTFSNGIVVFSDLNGQNVRTVNVGNLPDMITFTPDGHYAITANEGQPNASYTIDPEGSISVIDISGGLNSIDQSKVTTLTFNSFDSRRQELINSGIRIFGLNNPTVSQDFEPEYVTVSDDSQTAWVSIQENNAIAKIDLVSLEITDVFPLGTKNHNLPQNSLDASDQFGTNIFMAQWPVRGVYMPDAIAHYEVDGVPYIISANEGDAREYTAYAELVRTSTLNLDPVAFPNANFLKINTNIGRLNATTASGDLDRDGDFDEIHLLGSRSFSIWNGNTGNQVYDSGNQLELITKEDPTFGGLFNASNSNNTFKNRSDDKGPEPEGVAIGKFGGKNYAFVALERTGGVVTYDVTNPMMPVFDSYINTRNTSTFAGDNGAEGIIYIAPENSPNGKGLVLTANEISATIAVFQLNNVFLTAEPTRQSRSLSFNRIGKNLLGLRWTNGNGQNRVLVASQTPLDGDDYVIDSETYAYGAFGQQQSNVSDAYVVYNGDGRSAEVTGLQNNTTYYFRVFDYNGTGAQSNYLTTTATGNPNSRMTLRKEVEDVEITNDAVSIYPNPVINELNINLNLTFEDFNLSIIDNTGREVYNTNETKNSLNLDVSNFANGQYHIIINNEDEMIYHSFIIQK